MTIDCATLLSASRLKLLSSLGDTESDPSSVGILSERFHYSSMSTLSHLLALVVHPPANFPPANTSLLVLDGISTLLDLDFPRTGYSTSNRTDTQKWQSNRRYGILGTLVSSLNKMAVLHNLAVIVTTGCNSKMRPESGSGAAIGPGIGGSEWEAGTHTRIVVFRDFTGRYAGVQKVNGRNLMPLDPMSDVRNIIGFEIAADGSLKESTVDLTSSPGDQDAAVLKKVVTVPPTAPVRKRIYDEIADSEDEDVDEYGWAERDDEVIVIADPVIAADAGKADAEDQAADGAAVVAADAVMEIPEEQAEEGIS